MCQWAGAGREVQRISDLSECTLDSINVLCNGVADRGYYPPQAMVVPSPQRTEGEQSDDKHRNNGPSSGDGIGEGNE